MDKPLISIVTVCYNSEKTIKDTIESVLNQTYTNIEYIMIDGASKDSTVEIIKSYEEKAKEKGIIYRWISEPDKGIYDAMNKGIEMASGELIGIINSDDWYETTALASILNNYENNSIIHCNINIIYGEKITKLQPSFIRNNNKLKQTMCIFHPTCFISREVYNKIGLYNLNYKLSSDYDLLLRAFLSGVKFIYLDKTISNMRMLGASDINAKEALKEAMLVRNRNGINPILSFIYYIYVYYFLRIKNELKIK